MQHEHVTFYQNSSRSVAMGGSELVAGLNFRKDGFQSEPVASTPLEMHIEIVEYLKSIPRDSRASYLDFERGIENWLFKFC